MHTHRGQARSLRVKRRQDVATLDVFIGEDRRHARQYGRASHSLKPLDEVGEAGHHLAPIVRLRVEEFVYFVAARSLGSSREYAALGTRVLPPHGERTWEDAEESSLRVCLEAEAVVERGLHHRAQLAPDEPIASR
eukprot:CAMPEP_0182813166 /NCGR_PEP_ID=MMETSP0006_2-20121128/9191_1 /TAXON_ID=97485 /ORGANISM="Prymnesium parvum, Strain Texoma1" /LENGTH=135 /DNA_ID=CAMNT_0024939237 /DNA_START=167 /DNA_END=571 /DNA_ORIENTATION=-